jgi:hypothetical protein
MIKRTFIVLVFLSIGCNSSKNIAPVENNHKTVCPSDGDCTTNIFKNKSLKINTDTTGTLYYNLVDDAKASVIKFEYIKTVNTTFQDNNYSEEIVFEIPNNLDEIVLENQELQTIKMLFGKHCFCRGQAGIYAVQKGKLQLTKNNTSISFKLNLEVPNSNHKITEIFETIK